ncbi:hypothetical protein HKX48_009509 [Thoreauomyces humboldtii]|nr:hypothetical protein HKX48_009509 [Thoreauomyces humboldtii]
MSLAQNAVSKKVDQLKTAQTLLRTGSKNGLLTNSIPTSTPLDQVLLAQKLNELFLKIKDDF